MPIKHIVLAMPSMSFILSSILSTTSYVLEIEALAGKFTEASKIPSSSVGTKPVGIILNKNPLKIHKRMKVVIVSFLLYTNFETYVM